MANTATTPGEVGADEDDESVEFDESFESIR